MSKKPITLIVAALALALAGASPSGALAKSDKRLTIMSSMPNLAFPFFVHMMKEVKAEAKVLGNIAVIESDGQGSTPKQTADVEAAIIKGVDGIIISPKEVDAMAPVLKQAVDAGIPVVTIDRRVDGVAGILAHVGADNVIGGKAQAELIMRLFPSGARIFNLQGEPGASPAIDRNNGVHKVLDKVSGKYKIIFEQTAYFARDKGLSVTEAGLAGTAQPPDVIVAANDDMALGALEAVRAAGLAGKIKILGFDALPEALASIRDGGLTATIEQFPGGQSRKAVQILIKFIRQGKKPGKRVTLLTPIAITKDILGKSERFGELK